MKSRNFIRPFRTFNVGLSIPLKNSKFLPFILGPIVVKVHHQSAGEYEPIIIASCQTNCSVVCGVQ